MLVTNDCELLSTMTPNQRECHDMSVHGACLSDDPLPCIALSQVRVKPRCGRLVGFSAGKENMHGVTAVTKGKRCAIALWFTLDPLHRESTFDLAADLLYNKLETKSP